MNNKFIDFKPTDNWEILTDSGFKDLKGIHKTKKYKKWKLKTISYDLNCADDHIVFVNNYEEKYVKDLSLKDLVITKNGLEEIEELYETDNYIHMYDAEINDEEHRYYTNGILSHNTSSLFVMAHGHPKLYINASEERGIDIIRDRISRFCSTTSLLDGKEALKCVILDEFDNATDDFYKALRAVMERYAGIARFIASANYIEKVPEAIQSRFNVISFDPIDNEEEKEIFSKYYKRTGAILDAAKISYTEDALNNLIHKDFPDMRRIMNKIQSIYLRGIKELNVDTLSDIQDHEDLFAQCLKKPDKPYENYKQLAGQYANKVDDALASLGKDFPTYLKKNAPDKESKIPLVIIAIAEYQYQKAFTVDPLVTLLACCFKIQNIINS